jgi:hypothetical protein
LTVSTGPFQIGDGVFGRTDAPTTASASTGITVATTNANAGVSATNGNLPPYYALCYIQKT